jgi:hypothetical protein
VLTQWGWRACAQGYVEAARAFERESGTPPMLDLNTITDRMEVRKAVQSGSIDSAIEKVNDMNPEVSSELFWSRMSRLHGRRMGQHGAFTPPPSLRPTLQILESQEELFFHLQQQRLIELIRGGDIQAALDFAEEYLAPQAEENPKLLEELGEMQGQSLMRTGHSSESVWGRA